MIVLYIDTTVVSGFCVALLNQSEVLGTKQVETPYSEAELLLPSIEALCDEKKCGIGEITECWVVTGPGTFTAIRIGVVVANALAYAQGILVRGIARVSADETMASLIQRLQSSEPSNMVEPVYDKPPHITKPA